MASSRRQFLRHVAGGAALTAIGATSASAATTSAHATGAGRDDYLGRTPGYRDWAVVPRGLTVKKIETFRREMLALVRVTASDGTAGWGQITPYDADISADVLHRLVARGVLCRDIADIDAINDTVINAPWKYPWSFVCRALGGIDTALWDLYGQILKKPVAVLLGGSVRPLPAYGSSMRTSHLRHRRACGCRRFETVRSKTRPAPGRAEFYRPAARSRTLRSRRDRSLRRATRTMIPTSPASQPARRKFPARQTPARRRARRKRRGTTGISG